MFSRTVCFIAFLLASSLTVQAEEWGSISGRILFDGEIPELKPLVEKGSTTAKDAAICGKLGVPDESLLIDPKTRGVANVAIYLMEAPERIHPDLNPDELPDVIIRAQGCRIVPHISLIRAGQTLRYRIEDKAGHNIHYYPFANNAEGFILAPNDLREQKFVLKLPETRPIKMGCDIHTYMVGWLLVLDHPYGTFTDQQGWFRMEKLPVGQHEFRIWHERYGWIDKAWKVDVVPGETRFPARHVTMPEDVRRRTPPASESKKQGQHYVD
ncbi:MAG: hypothetical protein KDA69_10565 [Planctomycetaceae bacterium]|nr:hypothetical protein [Planctomycetaceae bacterium]MCA9044753.1 hypothetical protein [Planctomycetaceae bacterium]